MTAHARDRRASGALVALLSLLALGALMESTLFVLVDPSLLGWRPDHGHLSVSGSVPPHHNHPSDAAGHDHAESKQGTIVFTAGDGGAAGSVTTAIAVPDSSTVTREGTFAVHTRATDAPAPAGAPPAVPSPPPRG